MIARLKLLPFLLLCGSPVSAEVIEAGSAGFATSETLHVDASPAQTWAALMQPSRWWNPQHSWSLDAANFSIEPEAGGCFCESLPDGGSVQHMTVIHAAPGRLLRMSGALGPLQGEALIGTLSITLTAAGDGTSIEWLYVVGGHARFTLEEIAPGVDGVMSEQLHRLAQYVADSAG